ncbi:MAG: NAD(P)/FAD-dependent oxidoreductase [Geminicoccaceae bacterium]|nr:NAD(P)/FAD-dependent oxidoreductase [Geminicoccaceae bacterium]
MERHEVIIVGGGPAGSSCAWRLKRHGIDALVLDRERFPRLKLCAGWITPEVVADLELDPATYPASFMTFAKLRIRIKGLGFSFATPQHSIRRIEFDDWLLRRSGAEVRTHNVRSIARDGDGFVVDDAYRCRWLVGAGGTRCPVYRTFLREVAPRSERLQAAVLEHEIAHEWTDGDCRLWFFEQGLPGYAWYVPKAASASAGRHVNVGVGGMATLLAARERSIRSHWDALTARLAAETGHDLAWAPGGYTYYLRGDIPTGRQGRVLVCGDALGLATRDMCEGIGPAIRSGFAAAETIARDAPYALDHIARHSLPALAARPLDWAFCRR